MFAKQLNDCLKFCNLNPSVYKSHSFRIGAASFAAEHGVSDAQIRIHPYSNAYYNITYIILAPSFKQHCRVMSSGGLQLWLMVLFSRGG
jgi:hypothetical protein